MAGYAHPEVLVATDWVADRLGDETARIVEVSLDSEGYGDGVIPGAVLWQVWGDLLDDEERLRDDPVTIGQLLSRSGISPDMTVVVYGDASNWGAALGFWLLRSVGHRETRLMDGGRQKWLDEGRPVSTEPPSIAPGDYVLGALDWSHRAQRTDVLNAIAFREPLILDVRLRAEYDGELFRPSGPPDNGQRAGHIPSAVHVPWETAVNEDGTFKSADELRAAYVAAGVTGERTIIPYCTIGGRSGHTWFVLSQLLGYRDVRLYEASWAEWGNRTDTPVE